MGLLDHLKTKENNFISISEAIHFLKNETNSSYAETIYFLELHSIHECVTYNKNEFEYFKTDCDFYHEDDEIKYHYFVYSLLNIREFIKSNIDDEDKIKNHIDLFKNIYWEKVDFYQSKAFVNSGLEVPEAYKKKDLVLSKENFDLKSHISSAIQAEKNKYIHAFFSLKFIAELAGQELSTLAGHLISQDFYKGMKIYIASELDFHTHIELAEHENHIADLYGNKAKNGTDALLRGLVENFYINTRHYEVEAKYFIRYWAVADFLNNPVVKTFGIEMEHVKEIQTFTVEKIKSWQNDWARSIDKISNLEKENILLKEKIEDFKTQSSHKNFNDIDSETKLVGLDAYNQNKQDAQGMARIVAKKLWQDDENILISDMANKVYAFMVDYCEDILPQESDTVRNWIKLVAPPTASKRGRPKKIT
ncbi:hypothetical protein [Acinetobacter ursingii]|uniref:hypothetical protein n=1 Tax=Acinetobacter ursingii TaxID=108980 RepID=UPI003AF71A0F